MTCFVQKTMKFEIRNKGISRNSYQEQQSSRYQMHKEIILLASKTMASAIILAILILTQVVVTIVQLAVVTAILTMEIVKWVVLTQAVTQVITFITWGPLIYVTLS